jgi:hypothetical protein
MKIASQEWFDMQGHKITVVEPESRGAFQDYIDEQRNLEHVRKSYELLNEINRRERIALGLELYDPKKEIWLKK